MHCIDLPRLHFSLFIFYLRVRSFFLLFCSSIPLTDCELKRKEILLHTFATQIHTHSHSHERLNWNGIVTTVRMKYCNVNRKYFSIFQSCKIRSGIPVTTFDSLVFFFSISNRRSIISINCWAPVLSITLSVSSVHCSTKHAFLLLFYFQFRAIQMLQWRQHQKRQEREKKHEIYRWIFPNNKKTRQIFLCCA